MSQKPLEYKVRQANGAAVVDLTGDINTLAAATMDQAYQDALALKPAQMVLNFSDVNYINSTGIALIVSLLAKARSGKVPVSVFGLTSHYLKIFEITRLSDFMDIHTDEKSALEGATESTSK